MTFRRFTPADDQRLVQSVQEIPVLFNHESFFNSKNTQLLKENWRAVAAVVGRDEETCKRRWRDIRDHYFKIKRKEQIGGSTFNTRWSLYKSLSFLDNAKRKKRHAQSDQHLDQDDLSDTENTIEIYEPETTFKVKEETKEPSQLEYVDVVIPSLEADSHFRPASESSKDNFEDIPEVTTATVSRREEDDVDMFMRSVAFTVKRFPPKVRAEAKLKILSLVTQLEFPNE